MGPSSAAWEKTQSLHALQATHSTVEARKHDHRIESPAHWESYRRIAVATARSLHSAASSRRSALFWPCMLSSLSGGVGPTCLFPGLWARAFAGVSRSSSFAGRVSP